MKKWFGWMAMALLTSTAALAQNGADTGTQLPGIAVVETRAKTFVYEIKLKAVANVDQATALDQLLLSRQGVLSAATDWNRRTCRVEALKQLQPKYLKDVVEAAGLQVAKSSLD